MMKKVACVIMASGQGKRFGSNKLLADFCGKTLIQRTLELTEGLFERRIVVTRTEEIAKLCEQQKIPVLFHAFPDRSDTVRLGVEAMEEMDACLFCPCDQPLLRRESLKCMLAAYDCGKKSIFRLGYEEHIGAPVLFDRRYFQQLRQLPPHNGGSYVIKQVPSEVQVIQAQRKWELFDVDTVEDMEQLKKVQNMED